MSCAKELIGMLDDKVNRLCKEIVHEFGVSGRFHGRIEFHLRWWSYKIEIEPESRLFCLDYFPFGFYYVPSCPLKIGTSGNMGIRQMT
jgi:hypothetical protein